MRTLHLSDPFLCGADVAGVQLQLGIEADGVYGPRTAAHVRAWKWRVGVRRRLVDENLSPLEQRWILGQERLPPKHRKRGGRRKKPIEPVWALRTDPGEASEFDTMDPDGTPGADGFRYHAAKDWFGFAGSTVRAPVTGTLVEVRSDRTRSGQVFGGTVKVRSDLCLGVWVFRHVDPLLSIEEGQRVLARTPIALVSRWTDGDAHAHVELWRSLEGGYRYENMRDPLPVIRRSRRAWKRPP